MKENSKKTNKTKQNKQRKRERKEQGRTEAIVKEWELNDFVVAFKLSFLQVICQDSLIFQSNLEFALSIILKQRELYESKHVAVECRCLKICDLLSFLIRYSILVLK